MSKRKVEIPPVTDYTAYRFAGLGLHNLRSDLNAEQEIALRQRVEELETELQTQAAALQGQADEIARLRGFVREIAGFKRETSETYREIAQSHLLMYGYWREKAIEIVASWESEMPSIGDTTESGGES